MDGYNKAEISYYPNSNYPPVEPRSPFIPSYLNGDVLDYLRAMAPDVDDKDDKDDEDEKDESQEAEGSK